MVWDPMGAENDALWQVDNAKTNMEKAYCCFNSNARILNLENFLKIMDIGMEKLFWIHHLQEKLRLQDLESPHYGYGFG